LSIALIGGLFGILGAFMSEVRAGGFILLPLLGAPIIEEALKPIGVLLIVMLWPRLLQGPLHAAFLAACAGLLFALIESTMYVMLYFPDHSDGFVLYRFTVPVVMHTTASFVVGLGINRGLVDWANGVGPLPKRTRNFYITGVALHAIFNTTLIILALTGVLRF
jgi:protease PrsW